MKTIEDAARVVEDAGQASVAGKRGAQQAVSGDVSKAFLGTIPSERDKRRSFLVVHDVD